MKSIANFFWSSRERKTDISYRNFTKRQCIISLGKNAQSYTENVMNKTKILLNNLITSNWIKQVLISGSVNFPQGPGLQKRLPEMDIMFFQPSSDAQLIICLRGNSEDQTVLCLITVLQDLLYVITKKIMEASPTLLDTSFVINQE